MSSVDAEPSKVMLAGVGGAVRAGGGGGEKIYGFVSASNLRVTDSILKSKCCLVT